MVWRGRPWFVGNFNFVLSSWVPFFDPFWICIGKIDQWVRVPRLPWEFWDLDTLTNLLKPVGTVIKVDQNTLLRLKGKFAGVCVNIDITEPLPGSLTVSFKGRSMKIPLIYEGLHEVCALCGSDEHQIEACLLLPTQAKRKVRIEKFSSGVSTSKATQSPSAVGPPPLSTFDNWIRFSPKKRVRTFSTKISRLNVSGVVLSASEAIPPIPPLSPINAPPLSSPVLPSASNHSCNTKKIVLACPAASNLISSPFNDDPLDAMEDDEMGDSPLGGEFDSQLGELPEDDFADSYLNLDPIQELELSSDSAKQRKVEEGDESISPILR